MHDALAMCRTQGLCYLLTMTQDQVERKRPLFEPRLQAFAFEVLHHQKIDSVLLPNVIERADVRMREDGNDARLVKETLSPFRISRKIGGQNLDGYGSV